MLIDVLELIESNKKIVWRWRDRYIGETLTDANVVVALKKEKNIQLHRPLFLNTPLPLHFIHKYSTTPR